jgi:hypothetical protein
MDMNNRKSETRSDQKTFDISIEVRFAGIQLVPKDSSLTCVRLMPSQEINNKFTISLGDLRTEIEQAKWDATRRAIGAFIVSPSWLQFCPSG